jgi:hypothetical protein
MMRVETHIDCNAEFDRMSHRCLSWHRRTSRSNQGHDLFTYIFFHIAAMNVCVAIYYHSTINMHCRSFSHVVLLI